MCNRALSKAIGRAAAGLTRLPATAPTALFFVFLASFATPVGISDAAARAPALSDYRLGAGDRLNLYENPLYNPAIVVLKPSQTKIALYRVKRLLGFNVPAVEAVTVPDPWEGMPPAQRRNAMREYLADAFRSGLIVIPSETSRLVTISYVSTDPEMAAIAATATAEA
jgi:hypothetical protein